MNRLLLCGLALLLAVAARGAADSVEAIRHLLNSRTSGSPRAYVAAAVTAKAAAKAGQPAAQYVVAILSQSPDWPEAERLTPEERADYLARNRPLIKAMAETKDNCFAWYLLYLESGDETALEKAIAGGNPQALNAVGTRRLTALLEDPAAADEPEAAEDIKRVCFAYFKRAADQGDANGLNNLGLCYQNGFGCLKDEATALGCFSKAAQQGHSEAVNNMGRFYREGIGVKRDLAAALRCFRLSAGQGNVFGQLNYSLALMRGEGTEPDIDQGLRLLESLARHGTVEAVDCLAEIYAKGIGTMKPDAQKAAIWAVHMRAVRGDKNAAEWLKENDARTHDR